MNAFWDNHDDGLMMAAYRDDDGLDHGNDESLGQTRNDSPTTNGHSNNNSNNAGSSNANSIGVVQLAVVVFYAVSGGPYGVEDSVRAAGIFWALVGFTVMPLVWSLPEALVTAELSCAFPEASGSVVWVEKAFGPLAGWINACLTYVAGATDNSIYPGLFLDYLLGVLWTKQQSGGGSDGDGGGNSSPSTDDDDPISAMQRYVFIATMTLILAYINYRGLPVVGNLSTSICLLAMSPFVVICLWGIPHIDASRWLQQPAITAAESSFDLSGGLWPNAAVGGVLLRPFLNNLYWNLNSFDSAGNFAANVSDPARTFPRAMYGAVVLVTLGYVLPLLVATGTSNAPQQDWKSGYLATVASDLGGPLLGGWVVLGAAVSNIGMFEAELSSDSYMLMGMADRKYLPRIFSKRSRHDTPTVGLLFCVLVILACLTNGMATLIEMENFCYSVALLMEYAAFVKLRFSHPDLERPYKIPFGPWLCTLFLVPNCSFLILVMVLASYKTIAVCFLTIMMAWFVYWWSRRIPGADHHHDHTHDYQAISSNHGSGDDDNNGNSSVVVEDGAVVIEDEGPSDPVVTAVASDDVGDVVDDDELRP